MNPIFYIFVLIWFLFIFYLVWESGVLGTIIMASIAVFLGFYFNSAKLLILLSLMVPILRFAYLYLREWVHEKLDENRDNSNNQKSMKF